MKKQTGGIFFIELSIPERLGAAVG